MKKNIIRLTESQLHRVIKESVNRILSESRLDEMDPRTYASYAAKRKAQGQTDKADAGRHAAISAWNKKYAHENHIPGWDGRGPKKSLYHSNTVMPYDAPWDYENDEKTCEIGNDIPNDHYDIETASEHMYLRDKEDGGVEFAKDYFPRKIYHTNCPPHDEGEKVARQMYKGDGTYIPGKGWQ